MLKCLPFNLGPSTVFTLNVYGTTYLLFYLDFWPRSMSVASLALRGIAYPVLKIAVYRSLPGRFWNALSESAAEFG